MKYEFKWGIIGPGRIARKFAAAVEGITNSAIYAIASKSNPNLKDLKQEFSAKKAYSSYETLVDDPDVDAVYIATPVFLHGRQVEAAARHGKHILCEKPLAATVSESVRLSAVCRDAGVTLGIGLLMGVIVRINN